MVLTILMVLMALTVLTALTVLMVLPAAATQCLRARSESPRTPPEQVFSRSAALQKLVSHKGWTAFLCLAGRKNPHSFDALGDPEQALRLQAVLKIPHRGKAPFGGRVGCAE